MTAESAKEFTLSIGIMQDEDATLTSPNQTQKSKIKNQEEAVSIWTRTQTFSSPRKKRRRLSKGSPRRRRSAKRKPRKSDLQKLGKAVR